MCKRSFAVLCCLFFCVTQAFSQDKGKQLFSQSAGITGFGGITQDSSRISGYFAEGITYSPRLNFAVLSPSSCFSIGTHLTAGFGVSTTSDDFNTLDNTKLGISYMVDAPLMVEYNFGAAATREAFKKWGFFLGGGYGWHFTQTKIDAYDPYYNDYTTVKENVNAHGPVFDAGFRFPIGLAVLGVRFQYQSISNPTYLTRMNGLFGMGVDYNFGAHSHRK